MLIPSEQLSDTALTGLIEEFVTRDGTDYGLEEIAVGERVFAVRQLLARGEVCIVFDEASATANLLTREQYGGRNRAG